MGVSRSTANSRYAKRRVEHDGPERPYINRSGVRSTQLVGQQYVKGNILRHDPWDCHRTADQLGWCQGVNVGIYGSQLECLG